MSASRARWAISTLAILGTLPYITLKLMWLSGSRAGLDDPDFGRSSVMQLANILTMALDMVAIAMALAFVTAWGRRLPAWSVLFPMWVGAGLLAPILVIVPLQLIAGATSASEPSNPSPIADWVYAMVYGGFMWQAVFLLAGFVLYVHHRWGTRLVWTRPFDEPLSDGSARLALTLGLVLLGGLSLTTHVTGTFRPQAVNVVGDAALVLSAGAGLVMLTGRIGTKAPAWVGIALTWVGSGAMAAWALYLTIVLTLPNDFVSGGVPWTDVAAELVRLLAGVTAAMTGAWLVRRHLTDQQGSEGQPAGELVRTEVAGPAPTAGDPA